MKNYGFVLLIMLLVTYANTARRFLPPAHTLQIMAAATKTPTRLPTKTPIKTVHEFKRGTINTIPPQNILDEVFYYLGGGGGEVCDPSIAEGKLYVARKPQASVLMTQSTMIVCGWKKGEVLKAKIIYPNGIEVKSSIAAIEDDRRYYGRLDLKPAITDPIGNYTFVIEGQAGTVRETAYFKKPIGPHLFIADKNTIMFYGFSANEKVRLFYYGLDERFVGWQEYAMDSTGQAYIRVSVDPNGYFCAIGKTGEVPLPFEPSLFGGTGYYPSASITGNSASCSATKPTRLRVGMNAEVTTSGAAPQLALRAKASKSAEQVHVIAAGRDMVILDGPTCADNAYWWYIRSEQGFEGWAREGDSEDYWIDPLP